MNRKRIRKLMIFALCICLAAACCIGCKSQSHEHSWDEGKVTTPAGCDTEGVMTYTCTVCGETRTEPIPAAHTYSDAWQSDETFHWHECTVCGDVADKAGHTWDEGEVTTEPTAEAEGVMAYTCTVCGATKEEPVPQPEVTEIANFTADFSGTAQDTWKYGYAKDFNFDTNAFTFVDLPTFNGEAWTDGDGIEIKADWLRNETGGAPAAVRYISKVSGSIRVAVSFTGSDAVTRMTARLHVAGSDGSVKSCEFIGDGIEFKDWTYEGILPVEEGDAVTLIFFTEGSAGYFHGGFSMTVSVDNHTHDSVATPAKAPTCTEDGWTAGEQCSVCGKVFSGHETVPATGHSFTQGWRSDGSNHWHVCAVCGAQGSIAGHTWDGGKVTKDPTMEAEGVKTYACTVCGATRTESVPSLSQTEIANFAGDFGKTQTGKWRYGYAKDYNFDKNTFAFHELPTFNGEAWTDNDGIEIKSDWLRNETGGAPAVIRYISQVSGRIQISVTFSGSDAVTRMTARLHIAKADGTVKACEFIDGGLRAKDWSYKYTAEVETGDAVSLIFFNEGDAGYFHGKFSMSVVANKHVHTPVAVAAKDPTCTEAGWTAGTQCSVCGEIIQGHEEIPATGHRYTEDWEHDQNSHWHVCSVCGEKAEEGAHVWNDGVVTTEPTADAEGVKTYTCDVCGETRTESIPKLTEVEIANYTKDFSGSQDGSWKYGYATDYHFDANTYTFHELPTYNGDAWTDNVGIELKNDWIRNETGGTQATIRYLAQAAGKVKVKLAFTGSDDITRVTARLHIATANGEVKSCEFISAGEDAKDWSYEATAEVDAGDTISVLFFNEGNDYFHGHFAMSVVDVDHVHDLVDGDVKKAPTWTEPGTVAVSCRSCGYQGERELPARKFADFFEDFTATQGTKPGEWVYGYTTDYFNNDNFIFTPLPNYADDSGWNGKPGIQIKRDWLLSESSEGADVAVGYLVPAGKSRLEVRIDFVGKDEAVTRFSARLLVVDAEGKTKTADFIADGQKSASWSVNRTVDVTDGDTVYVILFYEGGDCREGKLQFEIGDAEEAASHVSAHSILALAYDPNAIRCKKHPIFAAR